MKIRLNELCAIYNYDDLWAISEPKHLGADYVLCLTYRVFSEEVVWEAVLLRTIKSIQFGKVEAQDVKQLLSHIDPPKLDHTWPAFTDCLKHLQATKEIVTLEVRDEKDIHGQIIEVTDETLEFLSLLPRTTTSFRFKDVQTVEWGSRRQRVLSKLI